MNLMAAFGFWVLAWMVTVIVGTMFMVLSQKDKKFKLMAGVFGFIENMLYLTLIASLLYLGLQYLI